MSAEGTARSAAAGEPAVWRRWSEIEPLFDAAMELAPVDRAAFLLNATQSDAELRSAVEELLHRVERTAGYLGVPAVEAYAEFAADFARRKR